MSEEIKNGGGQGTEQSKKKSKKWIWAVVVIFIIIAIASAGGGGDKEPEQASKPSEQASSSTNTQTTSTEQQENTVKGTLGFTPEEFKERFNTAAKEFESDFRISNLKITQGEVQDTFQYMLTDHLGLIGSVNKADGSVRDVMILGQGDGTALSGLNIITAMGVLIAAVNPELSADARGGILKDLGLFDENIDILNLDNETIVNGTRYYINSSEVLGIMFGVTDPNDE